MGFVGADGPDIGFQDALDEEGLGHLVEALVLEGSAGGGG